MNLMYQTYDVCTFKDNLGSQDSPLVMEIVKYHLVPSSCVMYNTNTNVAVALVKGELVSSVSLQLCRTNSIKLWFRVLMSAKRALCSFGEYIQIQSLHFYNINEVIIQKKKK